MSQIRSAIGLAAFIGASSGVAACSSTPAPHDLEASSQAAIRTASEMQAEQVPQAALHLKLAQEQFEKGKALMNDGDNKRAGFVLLRAQADAELALAMARENRTRVDAQQMIDKVRAAQGPVPTSAAASPAQVTPAPQPR